MSEIVIFGNSPFINSLDMGRLLDNFDTVGFNTLGSTYPVSHLFYFDTLLTPVSPKTVVYVPYYWSNAPKHYTRYRYVEHHLPLLHPEKYRENCMVLHRKYFTSSVGINWALLNGYKKIYLAAIDHVESDESFNHFDESPSRSILTPPSHKRFKQFVYECAQHAEIYQTNPAVKDQWDLPFKDIKELY